jgi:hypothetical protein
MVVIPRECGVSSTPRLFDSIINALEYWIIRLSLSSGGAKAPTRWRMMTTVAV